MKEGAMEARFSLRRAGSLLWRRTLLLEAGVATTLYLPECKNQDSVVVQLVAPGSHGVMVLHKQGRSSMLVGEALSVSASDESEGLALGLDSVLEPAPNVGLLRSTDGDRVDRGLWRMLSAVDEERELRWLRVMRRKLQLADPEALLKDVLPKVEIEHTGPYVITSTAVPYRVGTAVMCGCGQPWLLAQVRELVADDKRDSERKAAQAHARELLLAARVVVKQRTTLLRNMVLVAESELEHMRWVLQCAPDNSAGVAMLIAAAQTVAVASRTLIQETAVVPQAALNALQAAAHRVEPDPDQDD